MHRARLCVATVFTFHTIALDELGFWINKYYYMPIGTYLTKRNLRDSPMEPRIRQCLFSVLDDPDRNMLVEGIFALHGSHLMCIFAKMSYDPGAPQGVRYKVENSIFWVM